MALTARRRGGDNGLSAWPGYVDALSTLLMVIIFVLLVFVLAQAFLSVALSGRDKQLDRVNRQLAEVSDMLSLERGRGADLQQSIAQINRELAATSTARDSLSQQLAAMQVQAERAGADRDTLRSERDRLTQQLADAALQARSGAARLEQLQKDLAASAGRTDAAKQETATVATQLAETRRDLATTTQQAQASSTQAEQLQRDLSDAAGKLAATNQQLVDAQRRLAEMQRQMADLDKTVQVNKETIAARLSDLAKLAEQNRALAALRDSLEKQAQDAAARTVTEEQRRTAVEAQLAEEKRLGESARTQLALFNQQVDELKAQLTSVAKALDLAKTEGQQKDIQIANLGQKLNVALAAKVEELQSYRSEFFGRLREVLANRPGIQIVGDRFVFQSEVLFPVGSAELTPAGQSGITALAVTIKDIAAEIPPGIKWIMRIDGHTDRQPIKGSFAFASNWELSAARAITVVKLLIADGVPAEHLAATGFGDNQPLDPADTPEAYAKNRRIELRLTDR
jgi:chemotaxis protein MotB